MIIWFVAAIPVLIMLFALAMERVERRLRSLTARASHAVQEHDVEELPHVTQPQRAGAQGVGALAQNGITGVVEVRGQRRTAMVHSRQIGQRS